MKQIILASASPRRREILKNLGLSFEVLAAEVDESSDERDPKRLSELLAARKGDAVLDRLRAEGRDLSDLLIIASDTVVAVDSKNAKNDNTVRNFVPEILGKPRDEGDAKRMLSLLSGKSHRVVSGIYLWYRGTRAVAHDATEVVFDRLSSEDIDRYITSGEPFGKAGAYAIQGRASAFISGIRGDYFNVVGLPVHQMCALFRKTFPNEPPLV